MVGCELYMKKRDSDWLRTLLESEFFGSCAHHQDLRKNEKNVYCIDCNIGLCRHCMKSHSLHRQLQICKYVYQDVVRLQDMQKHLDCSKIQTYKINGEKAVHLNPRPQSKDTRPSTKAKFGASCEACGRYLQDLPNCFCCIACKVSTVSLKPYDPSHKVMSFPIQEISDLSWKEKHDQESQLIENESSTSVTDASDENQCLTGSELKPRKQLHKRKGVPRRSPFC
ncbi:hypothetical protein K2173_005892 [Erythroxylum novogranatense]|uniref:B box-type domain-containing protein n=1 Tax=Erythroxylum novogranatense TaxID=1862640 RepID=A0AAV8U2Y6_9ROSI|nr:hypothetical protein K2173_005892 [Erythroxylum novogranatense]